MPKSLSTFELSRLEAVASALERAPRETSALRLVPVDKSILMRALRIVLDQAEADDAIEAGPVITGSAPRRLEDRLGIAFRSLF